MYGLQIESYIKVNEEYIYSSTIFPIVSESKDKLIEYIYKVQKEHNAKEPYFSERGWILEWEDFRYIATIEDVVII